MPKPETVTPTTGAGYAGGDLQVLRGQNRVAVLSALHEFPEGASLTELHRAIGLSRPTLQEVVDELESAGLAIERPQRHSTSRGGRPGRRYELDVTRVGVVGGVVIGLDRIDLAIADARGEILIRRRAPITDPTKTITIVRDECDAALRELGRHARDLRALTVGILGIVSPTGAIRPHPGRPELTRDGAFDPITETFSAELRVINDANLAAMAEYANREQADASNMVALHADIGIGCGIVLDGRLHAGRSGAAGELGFLPLLGWSDSHELLLDAARERDLTVAALFERAGFGDPTAVEVVGRFAQTIAPGVVALVLAFDPDAIIVGGDICAAREAFRVPLEAEIQKYVPAAPPLVTSTLGGTSVLLGAISSSRETLWRGLADRALSGA